MNLIIILFIIIIILILNEIVEIFFLRPYRRKKYYKLAKNISNNKNKPLMVIGDPYTGNFITRLLPKYECGDICIDISGCNKCPKSIKEKIENVLPYMKSNSYVIYISCVLEFVDNIKEVIRELVRVSGGDLYINYVKRPYFLVKIIPGYYDGYKYFKFKNILLEAPPEHSNIKYKLL